LPYFLQNRTFCPYLAAIDRALVPIMDVDNGLLLKSGAWFAKWLSMHVACKRKRLADALNPGP
jgi:hypothetical protein